MFEFLLTGNDKFGVFLQGTNFFVDDLRYKKIEIDSINDLNFNFYFCNQPSILFPVNLKFDAKRWLANSQFVELTKIDNQRYICKICKKNSEFLQKKAKKIEKNGLFFNFFQNGTVEIESQNDLLFCENFDFEIANANVVELKNNFYALNMFSNQNTEKTVLINGSFASVMAFDNVIFEKTENGFKILREVFDVANHGIVERYEFADDIKKVDEYTVYMKNHPLNKFALQVLPIYFLQCVKANDFGEAKKYLVENIKSKVSNESLQNYFGDFVDILTFDDKIYLRYYIEKANNFDTRLCKFAVSDGKIFKIDLA